MITVHNCGVVWWIIETVLALVQLTRNFNPGLPNLQIFHINTQLSKSPSLGGEISIRYNVSLMVILLRGNG